VSTNDLSELSMLDLFGMEADSQGQVLTAGLLALERQPTATDQLELCMRAAHSLKGAAAIIDLGVGVRVAHAMEDCFVAAQAGRLTLEREHIDRLLSVTDLLLRIAHTPEADIGRWVNEEAVAVAECLAELAAIQSGGAPAAKDPASPARLTPVTAAVPQETSTIPAPVVQRQAPAVAPIHPVAPATVGRETADRALRVTAESLNRLLGLASESLVESRWIKPFAESLLRLKRMQHDSCNALAALQEPLSTLGLDERTQGLLTQALRDARECHEAMSQKLAEIEMFDRRSFNLASRLYDEALACRMRPFADGMQGLPRMVRDVAHTLGKAVRLEIVGGTTQVDRDVLAKLEAPLGHLLRNAVDHGIETPEDRRAAGKPAEGVVRLEARHSAGALLITISDDGYGVELNRIRDAVVARHLLNRQAADKLTEAELFEFLFLPGFTMKTEVTSISGRGVGLDVVQDMMKEVRGIVRVSSERGKGTRFLLQLPVTLSVVRTLLVDIAGEPYAFPLSSIVRTLKLAVDKVELLEGRQHFAMDGRRVGLVTAHQVLGLEEPALSGLELCVIVVGDHGHNYGLVVDRFLGERELVVHRLDSRLGKIKDISAGALMEDGSPVLIVDPEDVIRSTERLVADGRLSRLTARVEVKEKARKRVLVVDDSLTVRELERKLLISRGYDVVVAVDGMDGWNAVQTGNFDLVITDIDMPRMDGIELVRLINSDPKLKTRPVMVVSYKDRDEDRRRGLEAGAAYYLTKGSFHDETLTQAVADLIGEASA
jgi:two-component system, chemotaxis family, sensor histidine kinase and response regulator WspE